MEKFPDVTGAELSAWRGLQTLFDRPGRYRIQADVQAGVIYAQTAGFWDADVVDRYFDDLGTAYRQLRAAGQSVGLLMDLRASQLPVATIAESMHKRGLALLGPNDRIAVVTSSTLVALQVKRLNASPSVKVTQSIDDGVAWLSTT